MTDKNSHHHHHHHHCCPKQLQRQQANQQQPEQSRSATTETSTPSSVSCKEVETATEKKDDPHQNLITSVNSSKPITSSHPHRNGLNSTLSTSTVSPNDAHIKKGLSPGQQKHHVITTNNRCTATPSSIVAANQHLNNLLNTPTNLISVTVAPFTGGPFTLTVNKRDSVEELKKAVAKKLKVLKDRICLLYRESQLSEGSLDENSVVDGSRITLLPRAETGLLAQKPEQSVMQALESLNDSQVVDFLSGKAPLNLTMRLGDHMMLIQLQLSTVNAASGNKRSRSSSTTASTKPASASTSSTSTTSHSSVPSNLPPCCGKKPPVSSPITQPSTSSRSHIVSSNSTVLSSTTNVSAHPPTLASTSAPTHLSQTNPANSNSLKMPAFSSSPSQTNSQQSPSNATTSTKETTGRPLISSSSSNQGGIAGNTKTIYKPKLDTRALAEASKNLTQTLKQLSSEVLTTKSEEERPRKRARTTNGSNTSAGNGERPNNNSSTGRNASRSDNERQGASSSSASSGGSTKATGKGGSGNGGAIIESMHHHGKGVYSGTFSGTLNPALQDRNGQPKRDITTIIHILNDLLCAQYKNYTPGTAQEGTAPAPASTTPSAPSSNTAANIPSKTQYSEPRKSENLTKASNDTGNPCGCSRDAPSIATNPPPIQKPRVQSTAGSNLTTTQSIGERSAKLKSQIYTIGKSEKEFIDKEIGEMFQDQIKVTKGKMEQLKRIMEERKAKRRARREARASPYSTSWSLKSSDGTMEMEETEDTVEIGGDSTVKMQVDTASTSTSNTNNKSGPSANSNGQNTSPPSQTGAGGNPSDIFNPELEPVTA